MKCLVCGKEYDGAECPECRFPNVQIIGDYDEELKKLQPKIEEYRKEYLKRNANLSWKIGLRVLRKIGFEGERVKAIPEVFYFGTIGDILDKDIWLDNPFVGFANANNEVALDIVISDGTNTSNKNVIIPGVKDTVYLNVGIYMSDADTFCIKLKDKRGIVGMSYPCSVK